MAIQDLLKSFGQRLGSGLTQVGGYDPMQQVSPEEAARRRLEGLSALQRGLGKSAAILSGDPRRQQFFQEQDEERKARLEEQKLQKLVEDFFKDPKYKNMVKIGGFDFAFKQQQADIERSEEEKANQAFRDSVKGTAYEDLIDVVGFETARDAYIANELKTQKLPADLQKLETLTKLRQKVIDDPSYTEDQYQQDATLLGVNQSFLKGKQEFITEYAKQLRGMKDSLGNPFYKDKEEQTAEEQIYEQAKQAYDIFFPKEPTNTSKSNEEPIDLGTLNLSLFPPRE
jgi:hypothetical protein